MLNGISHSSVAFGKGLLQVEKGYFIPTHQVANIQDHSNNRETMTNVNLTNGKYKRLYLSAEKVAGKYLRAENEGKNVDLFS
ncbi:MAG: hypothetical protein A2Y25_06650 [Candidatus Melainabacteria bacterium GWF2_37_15]|nr:MAG: hypothetical protein A2Y25_06650 [Candidatus Melainabacteria bacterium GWF2_37_15]